MGQRTNTAVWLPNQQRWQIKVQKNGVRKTFTSAKPGRTGQREANRKADAWLDEGIASTTKRCADVWAEFMISVKATAGSSYIDQVEKFGRNYILPVIGPCRIGDLNAGMLQDVLDRSYKEGSMNPDSKRQSRGNLSKKTLQGIRGVEVAFVNWARQHKYTALRPEDENLTVPKGARNKGKKILQPDALRVLLSTDTRVLRGKVVHDDCIHAYRLAVMTGLRPGEIIGLRWCDIHGSRCDVRRSINIYKEETHGKNENAVRSFALTDTAKAVLNAQRELTGDFESVLCIKSESTYRHRWALYCNSNGINPCTPYELRHTFVSMMKRLPEGELKQLVGHSKDMDTFGVYAHTLAGDAENTARAVNGVFLRVLKNA